MKVEVLVSSIRYKDMDLFEQMNIQSDALLISQLHAAEDITYQWKNGNIHRSMGLNEKGLSRSRNRALQNAHGDICVIADDDMFYFEEMSTRVQKAYEGHPKADIIVFNVKNFKDKLYGKKATIRINNINLMRVSSVQITFKRVSVLDAHVQFNTYFGAGSCYSAGEENIFLAECLRKGLEILYLPITIGELTGFESTWFTGNNVEFFRTKGALFEELYGWWSWVIMLHEGKYYRKLVKKG